MVLRHRARGEDDRLVVPDRPRKSSGSETTFAEDLTAPADIEAGVIAMADDVWAWQKNEPSRTEWIGSRPIAATVFPERKARVEVAWLSRLRW